MGFLSSISSLMLAKQMLFTHDTPVVTEGISNNVKFGAVEVEREDAVVVGSLVQVPHSQTLYNGNRYRRICRNRENTRSRTNNRLNWENGIIH